MIEKQRTFWNDWRLKDIIQILTIVFFIGYSYSEFKSLGGTVQKIETIIEEMKKDLNQRIEKAAREHQQYESGIKSNEDRLNNLERKIFK